jgi:hypothetical protein
MRGRFAQTQLAPLAGLLLSSSPHTRLHRRYRNARLATLVTSLPTRQVISFKSASPRRDSGSTGAHASLDFAIAPARGQSEDEPYPECINCRKGARLGPRSNSRLSSGVNASKFRLVVIPYKRAKLAYVIRGTLGKNVFAGSRRKLMTTSSEIVSVAVI